MQIAPDHPAMDSPYVRNTPFGAKISRLLLVLTLGALGSIPLVFLTPPFQVPDEAQHFYRAYQLSELHFRAEVQNGIAGGTLPDSLPQLVKSSVYTADGILYLATPAPLSETAILRVIPLQSSIRHFVGFPGSAFYSPLPYMPQSTGIAIGRMFGLGPLYLLYLGRLFNCLVSLGLVVLAFCLMPFAEDLILFVGLLPMALFLYASLSADAAVIGCALVFCAWAFSVNLGKPLRISEVALAAVAGAVFCSVKPVYAPLLFVVFVPGIFKHGRALKLIRLQVVLLVAALGITAIWLVCAKSSMTSPLNGAHPSTQLSLVAHDPLLLVRAILHTFGIVTLVAYYMQLVGVFGWLTVTLHPAVIYLLPFVNLVVIWRLGVHGPAKRSVARAAWYFTIFLTCVLLVMTALYLMWARVGQNNVAGVQGRYFIPVLCVGLMSLFEFAPCAQTQVPNWKKLAPVGIIIIQIVAMDFSVVQAFHVFASGRP
jgi:uncharacterized membrane protein